MTATWPAHPPHPVPAGEGRSELKRGGPGVKTEGQMRAGAARAANRPGISPVSPRNAVPDRVSFVIEGHQGLISPFLTRNLEAGVN